MQFNMEQWRRWYFLTTIVIILAIFQAEVYQQNAECTLRKCVENASLIHTLQRRATFRRLSRTRVLILSVLNDLPFKHSLIPEYIWYLGLITFPSQTTCFTVNLGLDHHLLLSRVLVQLFWCAPMCDYCVHTCPHDCTKEEKEPQSDWSDGEKMP